MFFVRNQYYNHVAGQRKWKKRQYRRPFLDDAETNCERLEKVSQSGLIQWLLEGQAVAKIGVVAIGRNEGDRTMRDPYDRSLGGKKTMIESPLIQELIVERIHKGILLVLTDRFGPIPAEIVGALQPIQDETKLDELTVWASRCPNLETFRGRLAS